MACCLRALTAPKIKASDLKRPAFAMNFLHVSTRIARYLWAAPCTAVGMCVAAPLLISGAKSRVVDGVVEVSVCARKPLVPLVGALPFCAITFGHVVFAGNEAEHDRLRAHERTHVRQYERWGAFFLLAYPAASLWQLLRGRRPYFDNGFEVEARDQAAREPRSAAPG